MSATFAFMMPYPTRSAARPYAFENVRDTMRFGYWATHAALIAWCDGSRYSLYASSSTTSVPGGTEPMKASMADGGSQVPVGLLGLAMNTTRVDGVIAAAIARRSWPRFSAGTSMPIAPRACVASGYTANACCE